ncbi:hypothetical protein SDC9_184126 [bioreactor metagenome]|uniref:Uncharacterized protein n=1 Tax=bioreactor metagenome TaxID=1076179 RepID=A0A645HDK9_9ZZZZ
MCFENFDQAIVQRLTFFLVVRSYFGNQHEGLDGVFIANERFCKITVAFLEAEQEFFTVIFFVLLDFFCDEFETGQYIHHVRSIRFGDCCRQLARYDRFQGCAVGWQCTSRFFRAQQIIQHQ